MNMGVLGQVIFCKSIILFMKPLTFQHGFSPMLA